MKLHLSEPSSRTRTVALFAALLLLAGVAVGDTLSGTVTNATTGKPAAGTSVTLVDPMGGMAEIATVKADGQGRFTFNAPAAQGPRLARAERGGVNYFKMVTPGAASVELSVYDAAATVEGISGSADVLRLATDGGQLQATELFAIANKSNPPRTMVSASTFEFALPEGAQMDGAQAESPNGQPISVATTPAKEKNHYSFSFALKPGETRLQIAYHLPYSGMVSFSPRLTRNFEHYVIVLPASMTFTPHDAKQFQAMSNQPGSNVQVSLKAQAGQDLSYSVSGTGTFPDEAPESAKGGATDGGGMGGATTSESRPGGGLGKPIDAPDGLAKYRWYILGVLLTVLVGGGIWTHERTKQDEAQDGAGSARTAPPTGAPAGQAPQNMAYAPSDAVGAAGYAAPQQPATSNLLLAALKEELFALEVERQQGKITSEEYNQARAALEQTLHRALARTRS
jgi:hypothetical protein